MHYLSRYLSPLGGITLASNGTALTGLWFDGQKYYAANLTDEQTEKNLPVFAQAREWLACYFKGHAPDFTPPFDINGTSAFRKKVWELLLEIPFGQVTTYGTIAAQMQEATGRRVSAQAVGGAVGHNILSLIIPCHRVIGSDGNITGYAGGADKKLALLRLEGLDTSKLIIPKGKSSNETERAPL